MSDPINKRPPNCPDCGHNMDWHDDGCSLSYCGCKLISEGQIETLRKIMELPIEEAEKLVEPEVEEDMGLEG